MEPPTPRFAKPLQGGFTAARAAPAPTFTFLGCER